MLCKIVTQSLGKFNTLQPVISKCLISLFKVNINYYALILKFVIVLIMFNITENIF